jgi:hypothetical protein
MTLRSEGQVGHASISGATISDDLDQRPDRQTGWRRPTPIPSAEQVPEPLEELQDQLLPSRTLHGDFEPASAEAGGQFMRRRRRARNRRARRHRVARQDRRPAAPDFT